MATPLFGPLTYKEWLIQKAQVSAREGVHWIFGQRTSGDSMVWTDHCSQGRYQSKMFPIRVDWPQTRMDGVWVRLDCESELFEVD